MTEEELALRTNVAPDLLRRLLRMLEYFGFVDRGEVLQLTELGSLMNNSSAAAGLRLNFEEETFVLRMMPEYFSKFNYRMPTSMTDTPFQYANHTKLDNHAYWAREKPEAMSLLQTYLRGYEQASIWDLYPIQDIIGPEDVFVDVAGGGGSHLKAARKACSGRGRYILQELSEVLDMNNDLEAAIEKMPHDMLKRQPIQGARVYLLSNFLHDHPDEVCRTILQQIKDAMKPSHSKLLISNLIMSENKPLLRHIQLDFTMLALSGGKQRTKQEWKSLIESVGLTIEQLFEPEADQNGLIECILQA